MSSLTILDRHIIYYGPHSCDNCGQLICRVAEAGGGNSFDYPEGPIYPNTVWHPHICRPDDVTGFRAPRPDPAPKTSRTHR